MNSIVISKGSEVLSFKSWQEVAFHLTSKTTPISSDNTMKLLVKHGWELVSVEKSSSSKSKVNHIEALIKSLMIIDKDEIKKLETERTALVKNAKTSKDMQAILDINIKIEKLSNPSIDKETFITMIGSMYDDYIQGQAS
jgi:ribosomal protein L11 methylase PrmA